MEVAATLDRMRDKTGVNGSAQRKRYERLVQVDSKRVLAYSTPSAAWDDFFSGETGDAIAERLPVLDAAVFDDGWGLVIDGHYASPEELTGMSAKIRAAEPKVPGFWEALRASRLSYDDVLKLTADQLQKGLQKHARR